MPKSKKQVKKRSPLPATDEGQVASLRQLAREKGEAALPELEAIARGSDLHLAMAALEVLGTLRLPAAADLLAQLAIDLQEPRLAKMARRGLYLLGQAGIRPQIERRQPLVTPPPEEERVVHAQVSAFSMEGDRLIIVVRANRLDAHRLAAFLINEKNGVMDVYGLEPMSKRLSEEAIKAIAADKIAFYEVPLFYCRRLVDEARRLNAVSGQRVPAKFDYWYALLEGSASEPQPPPQELSPQQILADPELLEASAGLCEEDQPWLLWFDLPELEPYLEELEKLEQFIPDTVAGTVNLSAVQAEGSVITRAIQETMTEERQGLLRKRLADMAETFWYAGYQEKARQAMAASLALQPDSGIPAEQHPLLRASIRSWLREAMEISEQIAEEAEEETEEIMGSRYVLDKSGLLIPGR